MVSTRSDLSTSDSSIIHNLVVGNDLLRIKVSYWIHNLTKKKKQRILFINYKQINKTPTFPLQENKCKYNIHSISSTFQECSVRIVRYHPTESSSHIDSTDGRPRTEVEQEVNMTSFACMEKKYYF